MGGPGSDGQAHHLTHADLCAWKLCYLGSLGKYVYDRKRWITSRHHIEPGVDFCDLYGMGNK